MKLIFFYFDYWLMHKIKKPPMMNRIIYYSQYRTLYKLHLPLKEDTGEERKIYDHILEIT